MPRQIIRAPFIVGIEKSQPFSRRRVDAAVSSRAHAGVILSDVNDPVFVRLQRLLSRVRRTVVDDNQFEVGECLGEHTFDRPANKTRPVESRDDGGEFWYRV